MIEHIHGAGEQHALIGLASAPGDDFREKGFAHAWVADQHEIGAFGEELQIEKAQDARLGLLPGFVVLEVKGVDAGLCLQAGAFETAVDGSLLASFQLHVSEPLQRGANAEILGSSFSQSRLHLTAHGRQGQLIQLLFEWSHRVPFQGRE